jgi:DnaJ homolog subfamily B member 12
VGTYTHERTMPQLKVKYYLNPREAERLSSRDLRNVDRHAEVNFINDLRTGCQVEAQQRMRLEEEARGWFSVDQEKLDRARKMKMPKCRRLEAMNMK